MQNLLGGLFALLLVGLVIGGIYAFIVFGFAVVFGILMFGVPILIGILILGAIWDYLKKISR